MSNLIYFNPAFDGGCLSSEPGAGEACFGARHMGVLALLDELELRSAMTAKRVPSYENLSMYLEAAKRTADNDGSVFFAQSLRSSPFSVASEMMRWRNQLVLSGWDHENPLPDGLLPGAARVLDGLAAVESHLDSRFRSDEDRLSEMISVSGSEKILEDAEIVVETDMEKLHPALRKLLGNLGDHGTKLFRKPIDSSIPEFDILHFKDSVDACLWCAYTKPDSLLVCQDTLSLEMAMRAAGKESIDASFTASTTPVSHLFVCIMKLLMQGDDYDALLDYLSAPRCPLDHFKLMEGENEDGIGKSLGFELKRILAKYGGFGDACNADSSFVGKIKAFSECDDKKEREIRKLLPESGKRLTPRRVKTVLEALALWADRQRNVKAHMDAEDPFIPQYDQLTRSCQAAMSLLDALGYDESQEIDRKDFQGILSYASRLSEMPFSHLEIHGEKVTGKLADVACVVNEAVWIGCFQDPHAVGLPFLCPCDIEKLNNDAGLLLQSENDAAAMEDAMLRSGLSHVKRLLLLYCDRQEGKVSLRHPFLINLAADRMKEKGYEGNVLDFLDSIPYEPIPKECRDVLDKVPAYTQCYEHKFDGKGLEMPDHVGPSTVEKLLERPFDYFVSYVLGLWDENNSNLGQVQGNVAHDLINRLFHKAEEQGTPVSADAFDMAFKAHFKETFEASVNAVGLELNLKENTFEKELFRNTLEKKSIPYLIEVIRHSGFSIAGSELQFDGVNITPKEVLPLVLNAKIDMLLVKDGQYFILDFKWTDSQKAMKERESQIKNGKDYQLVLYRKVVETGNDVHMHHHVMGQAFLLLRTAEVLTSSSCLSDSKDAILPIQLGKNGLSYDESFEEIISRFREVMTGYEDGLVKEGEGMLVLDDSGSPVLNRNGNPKKIEDNSYGENKILKGKLK